MLIVFTIELNHFLPCTRAYTETGDLARRPGIPQLSYWHGLWKKSCPGCPPPISPLDVHVQYIYSLGYIFFVLSRFSVFVSQNVQKLLLKIKNFAAPEICYNFYKQLKFCTDFKNVILPQSKDGICYRQKKLITSFYN